MIQWTIRAGVPVCVACCLVGPHCGGDWEAPSNRAMGDHLRTHADRGHSGALDALAGWTRHCLVTPGQRRFDV